MFEMHSREAVKYNNISHTQKLLARSNIKYSEKLGNYRKRPATRNLL